MIGDKTNGIFSNPKITVI